MTTYLTATQAAKRLDRTERTVRRWIDNGQLKATQVASNRLAIPESEVERKAAELAAFERPAENQDTSSLEQRVNQLEQELNNYRLLSGPDLLAPGPEDMAHIENRLDALEQRLAEIERILSVETPAKPATEHNTTRTSPRRSSVSTAAIAPLENLPQGSIQHFRFAELHGVKPRTFLDHIHKGYVPSIPRQKPKRKETTHWLSPEMQRQAIDYWRANDTPFHECENRPSCPCHQLAGEQSAAGQDQQSEEAMI